jgi:hypothetical protein
VVVYGSFLTVLYTDDDLHFALHGASSWAIAHAERLVGNTSQEAYWEEAFYVDPKLLDISTINL